MRTAGKDKFYIPAGKIIDAVETLKQALQREIRADSEIEEVRWMGGEYSQLCAPSAQQAIEFLHETGKVVIEDEVVV